MASEIFDDTFIGTVVKINKATREVAVYIPKLMVSLYDGEATEYKLPTNNGLDITTSNNISSTITKTNYIWTKPFDMSIPLPKTGSKVFVIFLDKRASQPKWWKCDIDGNWEVIDEEKYPKQHSVTINNRELGINLEDNLTLNIPEYFKVSAQPGTEDKLPTFHISENYTFYKNDNLETSISNLQKSMEYIEGVYNKVFTDSVDALEFTPIESAAITFPEAFTDIDGNSVFTTASELDYLRDHISNNLDEIAANITIYPITYRNTIKNKINDTKHVMETLDEPTDTKYWQIVRQFYEWLEKYNFNLSGFITNSFLKIKSKCKTQIKLSQNLLDSSEIYTQYSKLLNGLKDTYILYNNYITKYNLLDNSIKTQLEEQYITSDIINNNIIVAFERGYDTIDMNSIDNYITYIKTLFPTQVTINYFYSDNGMIEENHYIETNKLFELNTDPVYTPMTEDNTKEDILPLDIQLHDATLVYDSSVYDWVTKDSDQLSIYDNYYLVKDITVKPYVLFAAIVYDGDELKLYVYDSTENTLTYTYNGSSSTIENINTNINDYSITTHTITVSNTHTTVTIVFNTSDVINNITDMLASDFSALSYEEFEYEGSTKRLYDNVESVYDKYLEYNEYITTNSITTNTAYTNITNDIRSAYGAVISNTIRSYFGYYLTAVKSNGNYYIEDEETHEHTLLNLEDDVNDIYAGYTLYDQFKTQTATSPILDLSNTEKNRIEDIKDAVDELSEE